MSKIQLSRTAMRNMVAGGCQAEGCTHDHGQLYISPKCHPGGGVFVFWDEDDTLNIECATCEQMVVSFALIDDLDGLINE